MAQWFYDTGGKPRYYRTENSIFDTSGKYAFWIDSGWWYRVSDGRASYYSADNWMFTTNGVATFYHEED